MKQIILILLAAAGFAACSDAGKQFKERNAGTDSIAINFFKTGGNMDTVTAVKIIRNKTSIEELTAMIGASATSVNDTCSFDGSIHFFKNDRVMQDVFFNSSGSCRRFQFRLDGQAVATELDDKAKDFLSALKSK